ncbi:MAG: hypothetical protein OSA38_07515 [Candidatus Poseidoniaceae archaeon]|nr:hypothetical protein [Candidatus Poseidoniaceae archaeon]
MDIELETYVDGIMEQQQHRSGIFVDLVKGLINAIADYRATPNSRGVYHPPGGHF